MNHYKLLRMLSGGLILAAVVLLVPGCRSTDKPLSTNPPGWLQGKDSRYPPSRYWLAVGSGLNHEAAANDARAELSKRLASRVSVEEQSKSSSVKLSGFAEEQNSYKRKVVLESVSKLLGVVIDQYYTEGQQVFALGVLDKSKTLAQITTKLEEIDSALNALPVNLENSFAALPLMAERDIWAGQYLALAGGTAEPSVWGGSFAEVFNRQKVQLQKHSFRLANDDQADGAIQGMLEHLGFVFSTRSPLSLKIKSSSNLYPSSKEVVRVKTAIKLEASSESEGAAESIVLQLEQIGLGVSRPQAEDDALAKLKSLDPSKFAKLVKVFPTEKF